ncbi:MAG TPA: hypothetical protein GYA07_09035 [Verrucomicrobia bacterium]|nr:hypothetical protein [Verrucomicrobiota bacterium]HOB31384.1 hypothetical protein [Verrucomicrobiota bacterium]HOP97988.1 hypothetical protein [Verrucomicrobiota bacterium]HPU55295.1 hypothetical protein [Verrucomicrobiota bacterium]
MKPWRPGARVVCVDDRFSARIREWTQECPQLENIYTIAAVVRCPEAETGTMGSALVLAELESLNGDVAYSDWRFEPWEPEFDPDDALFDIEPRDWSVDAGRCVAELTRLFRASMNQRMIATGRIDLSGALLDYYRQQRAVSARHVGAATVRLLCAVAAGCRPAGVEPGELESGILIDGLMAMAAHPAQPPSRPLAEILNACGFLGSIERRVLLAGPGRRTTERLERRFIRLTANVVNHAIAAGLLPPDDLVGGGQSISKNGSSCGFRRF